MDTHDPSDRLGKLYKTIRLAEFFEVEQRTIQRWIKKGRLKAKKIGRSWRVPESEVLRFMNEGDGPQE